MTTIQKCIAAVAVVGIASGSYAMLSGPSNYEDCLLENMKGVQSDNASRAIIAACRNKFSSQSQTKYISEEEFMGKK